MLLTKMAPGKKRVRNENKSKITQRKKESAIKKAKKNSRPKKQLKERTFEQIEEVDKSFSAIHEVLVRKDIQPVKAKGGSRDLTNKEQIGQPVPSMEVTEDELSKTVENIASL